MPSTSRYVVCLACYALPTRACCGREIRRHWRTLQLQTECLRSGRRGLQCGSRECRASIVDGPGITPEHGTSGVAGAGRHRVVASHRQRRSDPRQDHCGKSAREDARRVAFLIALGHLWCAPAHAHTAGFRKSRHGARRITRWRQAGSSVLTPSSFRVEAIEQDEVGA